MMLDLFIMHFIAVIASMQLLSDVGRPVDWPNVHFYYVSHV